MNKAYLYHIIAVILYRPHHSPKVLRTSGRVWQPLYCLANPAKWGCGLILLTGSVNGYPSSLIFYFLIFILFYFLTLQYCIGFAIYQNESATGIHVFPILNLPPSSLPIPSLWVVPVHQPQASSIKHRTWTGDSFHIWY